MAENQLPDNDQKSDPRARTSAFDLTFALKSAPPIIEKKELPASTLVASVVAVIAGIAIAAAAYFALRERPADRFVSSLARSVVAETQREIELEKSFHVESCDVFDTFVSSTTYDHAPGYEFVVKVKNVSPSVQTHVPLRARTIRDGRPAADFETSDSPTKIRGGISPGETLAVSYLVRSRDLWEHEIAFEPRPKDARIEVSVDGRTWITALPKGRSKARDDRETAINDAMLPGTGGKPGVESLREKLKDIPDTDTDDADEFFEAVQTRLEGTPGFVPASQASKPIDNNDYSKLNSRQLRNAYFDKWGISPSKENAEWLIRPEDMNKHPAELP
jgi:hypothetical protein